MPKVFDTEGLMERMRQARERADELSATKSRLTGELATHEKRLKELADDCERRFGVTVEELPDKVSALYAEAEKLVLDAENILGEEE